MTIDCVGYVFTRSTVPATGPRGTKGHSLGPLLSNSSSFVIEACRDCLEGHGGISCATETSGHTPEAAQRFAPPGAKGLTARSTRNDPPALIGDDHAWAASVFVHRN